MPGQPQDPNRTVPNQPAEPQTPVEAPNRTTPEKRETPPQAGKGHGDGCGC